MDRAAQIYLDHSGASSPGRLHIPAMGLHERMPPGLIRHGGPGSGYPCLLMVFHTPAWSVAPDSAEWLPAGGRLVVWDREASHHYGNSAKPWDHSWLHVEGSWIERRLRQTPVPLGVAVEVGHAQPLRYWRMLHDELRGGVRQDPDMIEALLQLFWLDLERQFRTGPAGRRADPRLERARRFIELHFDRPFHLADAARQAHLAPSHFCSRFSRQYGVPPREYAMRLRMQRGAQLLANQELAVREVAEMVGCEDALYFSRLFRRRYGVSPRQFRRAA